MSMMRTLKFRLSFTIISILLLCGCVHSYEVSGFRHSHNNLEPPPGRNSHLLPNATPASVRNCPSNYSCSAVGTCVNGVCVCWYGRSGFDCSEKTLSTKVLSALFRICTLFLMIQCAVLGMTSCRCKCFVMGKVVREWWVVAEYDPEAWRSAGCFLRLIHGRGTLLQQRDRLKKYIRFLNQKERVMFANLSLSLFINMVTIPMSDFDTVATWIWYIFSLLLCASYYKTAQEKLNKLRQGDNGSLEFLLKIIWITEKTIWSTTLILNFIYGVWSNSKMAHFDTLTVSRMVYNDITVLYAVYSAYSNIIPVMKYACKMSGNQFENDNDGDESDQLQNDDNINESDQQELMPR